MIARRRLMYTSTDSLSVLMSPAADKPTDTQARSSDTYLFMPLPLIGGIIKRCLSDVCLSVAYIGPKSRTERPRKTKIRIEVAHTTRDSDTTFKVKGQGHQAALLTAALTRQAAAAVSVGTYWPWEPTATLWSAALQARSAWRREALRRLQREERGGGILWRPPVCSLIVTFTLITPVVRQELKDEFKLGPRNFGAELRWFSPIPL